MTLHDLNQLRDLRREIEILNERQDRADVEDIIEDRLQQCCTKLREVEMYISNIDDSLIRQVMMLRFAYDMSWREVAAQIGGNNTEDSVRKLCSRYLETCPECPE